MKKTHIKLCKLSHLVQLLLEALQDFLSLYESSEPLQILFIITFILMQNNMWYYCDTVERKDNLTTSAWIIEDLYVILLWYWWQERQFNNICVNNWGFSCGAHDKVHLHKVRLPGWSLSGRHAQPCSAAGSCCSSVWGPAYISQNNSIQSPNF